MRAGAQALSLLSMPLNVNVITALADGPMRLVELREAIDSPPQTTLRVRLRGLRELGIVDRERERQFPGPVGYRLDGAGRDLLKVIEVLDNWLSHSPQGPLQVGSTAAKSAIGALTEGWSSTVIRALAARPLSLTELNRLIVSIDYPSLERRLAAMRAAKQIEAQAMRGGGTPYVVTDWLRRATGPLVAATRWERHAAPDASTPPAKLDIEAMLLLSLPLLALPADVEGRCRLAVHHSSRTDGPAAAGAVAEIRDGRVTSCAVRLDGTIDGAAHGTLARWLQALAENDISYLERRGDLQLVRSVFEGLHAALFDPAVSASRRTA
jgi:DNA-binding HxlR family transcriptional regulator